MNELTKNCITWIQNYFKETNGKKAIIGISGGKDSTVCAALCCKALSPENVIGILMPNGQKNSSNDMSDSISICNFLGIRYFIFDINETFNSIINYQNLNVGFSKQGKINLAPRIRTTLLYLFAQSYDGGRVCNTSNLCELMVGWGTFGADTFGDFSPLGKLLVSEIKSIGHDLNIPSHLVEKAPADGLTGNTDEDNFGFTYDELEKVLTGENVCFVDQNKVAKIKQMIAKSQFKRDIIHLPTFQK